jgi:hypothetical protein
MRKRMMQEKAEDVEDGEDEEASEAVEAVTLRVPSKSPRKHLTVQVGDKTRVTIMSVPTWLLIRPC